MDPIFRRIRVTSIPQLLEKLQPVHFPDGQFLTAVDVIRVKAEVRNNCDLLLQYVHAVLPRAMADPGYLIIINQLRRDVFEVRQECGKVSVNFLRPRHRRILASVRNAYEEMRLAAVVVCQRDEPALMDSITVAL